MTMFAKITFSLLLAVCYGTPINEEQLRSLVFASPARAAPPPLYASLRAVSPLNSPTFEAPANTNANQMAQLNLAGGINDFLQGVLGSVNPQPESPNAVDPLLSSLFPGGVPAQPIPTRPPPIARMPPPQNTNMFNPLSFLFGGGSGGSPFGMMMPGIMMRMMENLFELF